MRASTYVPVALLAVALGLAAWLMAAGPPAAPPAPPAAAPADPVPPPAPPPPPEEGPPLVPPEPAAPFRPPSQGFLPSGLPEWDYEVPAGVRGPVVVGRVTKAGDPDPDCWIALERADDPGAEDGSVLESFNEGGFRLTRFPEGRYRVRARMDGAAAVYSREFDAVDGSVVDAGLLVLREPGAIAGVVLDPAGEAVDAVVHLFGRDPASLKPRVVATARAVGRQGFQLPPHEAGPFTLAVVSGAGWARAEGETDGEGLCWREVRLAPYGSVAIDPVPEGADPLSVTLAPVSIPDLGSRPPRVEGTPGAVLEGLLPGKWLATVQGRGRSWGREITVEAGRETRLDPR